MIRYAKLDPNGRPYRVVRDLGHGYLLVEIAGVQYTCHRDCLV